MSRQEEIRHKAGSISDGMIAHNVPHSECKGYYEGYIDGAKYADKTMMEKALQWLKAHIKFETVTYSDVWDMSVVDILATDFATVDEMEESFRKVMEE